MFKRIFATALLAGLAAGAITAVLQTLMTNPLIMAAEAFESTGLEAQTLPAAFLHVHGDAGHAESGGTDVWAPEEGLERMLYSGAATIVTGVGFALLLTAAFAFRGEPVSGRRGVVWGMAGFAAFTLAPALGLPPELPGSAAADIGARQAWWIATAAAAALGLWAMVFSTRAWMPVVGLILLAAPHIYGAPHPELLTSDVPAELAAEFSARALAVNACFWALLGWFAGSLYHHFSQSDQSDRGLAAGIS